MTGSSLSFASTSSFRDALMAKNLAPYTVTGVYTPPAGPITYEVTQTVSQVIDSPDSLIHDDPYAQQLYPLNEYGPEGGYNLNITYNNPPLPVNSNQGEYSPNDTVMDLVNEFYIDAAYIENRYGPDGGFKDMVIIDSIQNNNKIYQPYWNPPTFVPSLYTPFEVLTSTTPIGSDGPLSQDSYLAKLGVQTLKGLLEDRIALEVYQHTVGAVNLQSLQDPFEASLLVTGQQPLIYRNWRITVPENPILATIDLATRMAGAYWPVSPIPGDYFDENDLNGQTNQTSTALNVTNQLTGGFLGPILNKSRNPSQIFLANTGNGQRSALFANINYNRYQPGYDKSFGGLLGVGQAIVNFAVNLINPDNGTLIGGYYVGSKNAEPSTITSPPNQIPVDPFGKQVQTPVYGPSELGILFEGNEKQLNFGLGGKSSSDGGGIDGQFVWVSPKYKENAGFHATPGGGSGSLDQGFNQISSDYLRDESTNLTLKESSILDQTQRLVDSADNVTGINRLKHVGNAINQVSKVFNDGYKEMTKGSQVLSYTDNTTGGEVGIEYCRVFTKDTPYYTYADLQKTDGITTSGRRFTNSILDNTYNLNIAPLKNPGSTNIVADGPNGIGGYAKKYMFSIENLAWRTSSRPGFTYDELPVCEKGPNGGRVMWFPPYDIKFSESNQVSFPGTDFLGRPEPIYTYKNTSRSGTLSWKIIVDHPSVMNTIVEKQLKGQNKERINSIIDSFFAGCVKFDIYELAKKFNTIPVRDLYTYQEILNNPRLTDEELAGINKSIPKENTADGGPNSSPTGNQDTNTNQATTPDPSIQEFKDTYTDLGFYFHNDRPDPDSRSVVASQPFNYWYDIYTAPSFIQTYVNKANAIFNEGSESRNVKEFFDNIIIPNFNKIAKDDKNFIVDAYNILKEKKGTIQIDMVGSASAPASEDYNVNLSKRRIDSVLKFFREYTIGEANLSKFIDDKTFIIKSVEGKGEVESIPKGTEGAGFTVNCTTNIKDKTGKVTDNSQVYSVNAMACRRVRIKNITVNETPKPVTPVNTIPETPEIKQIQTVNVDVPKPQPTVEYVKKLKEGISKKILRNLLSECDYFDVIKEEVPMVYDAFKEKIRYFNPAFHSTTPEGLNARLTFLNQCVRPGETIPIIGTDGKPKYNDAVNTSFGAPPILVLRLGDFINTKIVPTALSFTYDPIVYDLNPEGIGVQPMIANVSLSFNIIGGMGLAKPVEQLQNALSFNYYANTEIYDERAVWTEDTSALDKKVVDAILASQTPATVNNVTNPQTNDGGTTIGEIITNIPVPSGQTGEITYQKIMDKLLTETKTYFETVTNQMQKITLNTNFGIEQLVNDKRLYITGTTSAGTSSNTIQIYGKPESIQERLDTLFKNVINDINSDTTPNPIIDKLLSDNFDSGSVAIRSVRQNMIEYISNLSSIFSNEIAKLTQEIVLFEQNYVQIIRKLNLINSKTDGKILESGVPRIYNISGTDQVSESSKTTGQDPTDTYDEFRLDYVSFKDTIIEFADILNDNEIVSYTSLYGDDNVFKPVKGDNYFDNEQDKRFFLVISRIFNDKNKIEEFKKYVIKGDLVNVKDPVNLQKKFDKYCDDLAKKYSKELSAEEDKFEKFKKSPDYKNYTEGIEQKMYPKGKTRKFNYTTVPDPAKEGQQKIDISNLYKTVNVDGDNKTFNGKVKFD